MAASRARTFLIAVGCTIFAAVVLSLLWIGMTWKGRDYAWYLSSPPTRATLIQHLGGEQVATIINNADRIEAVLIEPPAEKGQALPHEYAIISEATPVPKEIADDIGKTLLTPELHRAIDAATSCVTRYGVRVSYFSGGDRIDLYLCFTCSDVAVYLNGKQIGGMKFIFACKRLIVNVRRIFPDEKAFEELERRCVK